ncbi:DUF4870 domain-containing protein [Pseudalkalibacillus decolorationis]|uniref:DUF4870 domain-containing protein n=1 Tax=Pseudalkalibacillus decolorationis TaxID=163879 RepID=UPI002147CFBD|nr:DUF4870 domain-containing protein [Pseudalkalibacillus decolorationis]
MSWSDRVISSISYLSIFCAPFLVAAIIYLTSEDKGVQEHARKALWLHLIPIVSLALLSITFFELGQIFNGVTITCIILFGGVAISVVTMNVVIGMKILKRGHSKSGRMKPVDHLDSSTF